MSTIKKRKPKKVSGAGATGGGRREHPDVPMPKSGLKSKPLAAAVRSVAQNEPDPQRQAKLLQFADSLDAKAQAEEQGLASPQSLAQNSAPSSAEAPSVASGTESLASPQSNLNAI
jgi:hypothetical protein